MAPSREIFGTTKAIAEALSKGAGEGVRCVVTGVHRYVSDAFVVPVGQPVRSTLHTGKLNITMYG